MTPREVVHGEHHAPVPLRTGKHYSIILPEGTTLQKVGAALAAVEAARGLSAAKQLAAALDYGQLTALCRKWQAAPATEQANDPNRHISPRHLLLLHMDDARLPLGEQPGLFPEDGFGPVRELTHALRELGQECPQSAVFDERVLRAWSAWREGYRGTVGG